MGIVLLSKPSRKLFKPLYPVNHLDSNPANAASFGVTLNSSSFTFSVNQSQKIKLVCVLRILFAGVASTMHTLTKSRAYAI